MDRAVKNRRIYPNRSLQLTCMLFALFAIINQSFAQSSTASRISVCSGSAINFVQSGAISGTTYTWSAPVYNSATVSGGTLQAVPQNSIIQTLVLDSTATSSATATYDVTPSVGATFQLIVTVNPIPVLSSNTTKVAVCSGSPYLYQPTSAAGGSITWSRALVNGISNNGSTGQGSINETLNNITTNAIDVTYLFALNANGCRSNQPVTVTINPTPYLTTTLNPNSICSGTIFDYTPQSIFPSTNFTWIRSSNAGINSGSSSSGRDDPNESLFNTTLFQQTAVYTYTLTDNSTSCVGT